MMIVMMTIADFKFQFETHVLLLMELHLNGLLVEVIVGAFVS